MDRARRRPLPRACGSRAAINRRHGERSPCLSVRNGVPGRFDT
ncbi:MAG: hypothetical protein AVDCRST_MAG68-829 [uncultured Gemmatimonadetes bacterium]|uniref:Uncharacterized protein n=1 Tax=uncultured Gemmatimonadota bacterium TaxID=203437 RepID=A0A6J4KKK6_9BACT|nr:MAG: hypothetical protein AVDCRST_MAG68-829 [uncultured Gemmatimonadota bacterium]